MKTIKDIKSKMEETKKEHPYSMMFGDNETLHQIEEETGLVSQLHLMHELFDDIVLSNTLCENMIRNGAETGCVDEIRTPYTIASARAEKGEEVEEQEYYEDEYQYFIVNLHFDEDTTKKILERANTDIYLRYDNDNDVYIMSVGNFGMSREMIETDIRITDNWDENNYFDDDDVIQDKIVSDVDSALDNGSSENLTNLSTDSKDKSGKEV